MTYDDSDLIQQTLEGDQQAFAALVERYQKQIHALAWQKIGDFHIAQEITQDTFFTAFQKLSTLTNHNRFAGWLYVIANRKCIAWHRKRSPQPQSLEATDPVELEEVYYSEYMTQQREDAANRKRRAMVQKLLSKLQESERTVVNLYYIAEMTCEEIGKFLGVSPNTVRSRLHRARNRLKKEEAMIKENLSSFQLPTQLTENIMKEIAHLNPVTPSGNKPLVPVAISAACAILAVLLIGIGTQHLYRFQRPYHLNAQSEPTIEITETRLVIDTPAKPAARTQIGRSDVSGKSNGIGQNSDNTLSAAALSDEDKTSKTEQQWVQAKGLQGGAVPTLFSTTRGEIYAGTLNDLYRLSDDERTWKLINTRDAPSRNAQNRGMGWGAMVENGDTLYLATNTEVLVSTDRGETWKTLGKHPGGMPIDMVITDHTFYLGLRKGVFRSDDSGTSWVPWSHLINDQTGNKIRTIASIKSTLFAGTDKGLYRLNGEIWEKIYIGQGNVQEKEIDIHDLTVVGNQLFVVAVPIKLRETYSVELPLGDEKSVSNFGWKLYHSIDGGDSWNLIAHKDKIMDMKKSYFPLQVLGPRGHQFPFTAMRPNLNVKIAAAKGRVVVIDTGYQSYSIDQDENWILDDTSNRRIHNITPTPVMLNPNTIYTSNAFGIYRSTDGGKSWQQFNSGLTGTSILTLVAVNDALYAITSEGLITSTDGGESWTDVFLVGGDFNMSLKIFHESIYVRTDRMLAQVSAIVNNVQIPDMKIGDININRLSTKKGKKTFIRETPTLEPSALPAIGTVPGSFAVSGTTYYAEDNKKLFRWKPNTTEWYNTGLIDEGVHDNVSDSDYHSDGPDFKLAASGNTVYVGKRDGHLMQSYDEGDTWNDVTANLPFSFDYFQGITFAGETVYVATDKGVVRSRKGTNWDTITDADGIPLIMDRLAVDGSTVYGLSDQKVYELKEKSNTWLQITPEIPYAVTCFDIDREKLYVGTLGSGVLRFALDK